MTAICHDEEDSAMALASASAGTRLGLSDCDAGFMKARATPNAARVAKIVVVVICPLPVR